MIQTRTELYQDVNLQTKYVDDKLDQHIKDHDGQLLNRRYIRNLYDKQRKLEFLSE